MQAGESRMIRRLPPRPKNLFQPRRQQLTWAAHAATSCLLFARDKQGGILFSDVFKQICDKWTLAEECPPYLLEVLFLFAVALGCKHLQRCAALLLGQYYLWCCWRSYCVWSCEMSIGTYGYFWVVSFHSIFMTSMSPFFWNKYISSKERWPWHISDSAVLHFKN